MEEARQNTTQPQLSPQLSLFANQDTFEFVTGARVDSVVMRSAP